MPARFPLTMIDKHPQVMEYLATRHAYDVARQFDRPGLEDMPGAATWRVVSENPTQTLYGEWLMEQFKEIGELRGYDLARFPARNYTQENLIGIARRFGPVMERNAARVAASAEEPARPADPAVVQLKKPLDPK